jgi:hypothetical protein|uniref:hypothetical protein n=1 Tax=Prosthecobacter sp. TaxID=1965333 RepID=UPI003784FB42
MTLLHSITLLLALLAQAWPVQAMRRVDEPADCGMSCCAALAAAEMSACGCAEPSAPAEPANAPPASGRERVPQLVWVSLEDVQFATRPAMSLEKAQVRLVESDLLRQPQVRLAVLFCSWLN